MKGPRNRGLWQVLPLDGWQTKIRLKPQTDVQIVVDPHEIQKIIEVVSSTAKEERGRGRQGKRKKSSISDQERVNAL